MSILSDQNLLAEPTLVEAPRRKGGAAGSAALYSFAHDYQAAESTSVTLGGFTEPSTYALDEEILEVAKLPLPTVTGVDGEAILQGTQYGNPGFAKASPAQQSNLGAAAEVIAGKEPAVTPTMPTDTLANESTFNKETGADTAPVASGGATQGFTVENKYEVNKNASSGGHGSGGYPQQMPSDDLPAEAADSGADSYAAMMGGAIGGGGATQTQPRPSGPPEVAAPVPVVAPIEKNMTGSEPGQTNQGMEDYMAMMSKASSKPKGAAGTGQPRGSRGTGQPRQRINNNL